MWHCNQLQASIHDPYNLTSRNLLRFHGCTYKKECIEKRLFKTFELSFRCTYCLSLAFDSVNYFGVRCASKTAVTLWTWNLRTIEAHSDNILPQLISASFFKSAIIANYVRLGFLTSWLNCHLLWICKFITRLPWPSYSHSFSCPILRILDQNWLHLAASDVGFVLRVGNERLQGVPGRIAPDDQLPPHSALRWDLCDLRKWRVSFC